MLLLLVRRCNSGPFSHAFQIAFHEPLGQILGAAELVDRAALASFLGKCQFKYGGIAKAPGEHAGGDFSTTPLQLRYKTPFPRSVSHIPLPCGDRYVSAA